MRPLGKRPVRTSATVSITHFCLRALFVFSCLVSFTKWTECFVFQVWAAGIAFTPNWLLRHQEPFANVQIKRFDFDSPVLRFKPCQTGPPFEHHQVSPALFAAYMRFHYRKLFREDLRILGLVKPPKGQIGLNALVPSKQGPQAFGQENRLTGSPRKTGFLDVSLEKSYETETLFKL